jgi:thiosulfate/3-mercaptopyruvate sulfurtransferase
MMGRIRALFAFVAWISVAAPVMAAEPLVDAAWLRALLGTPGLAIVDIRTKAAYARGHVPGAVNAEYGGGGGVWRVKRGDLPNVMLSVEGFSALAGRLGIDNDAHVVIVSAGAGDQDVAAAAHVYWMFALMDHRDLSILNGGMRAWSDDAKGPLETDDTAPGPRKYRAEPRTDIVAQIGDVRRAIGEGLLVDYRSTAHHLGINKSSLVRRYGTLPGATNVPVAWLTVDGGNAFHSIPELRKLFAQIGVPVDRPQIAFGNIGTLAAAGWFVSYALLGNKDASLYDNGLAEWTLDDNNPMDRKIVLD